MTQSCVDISASPLGTTSPELFGTAAEDWAGQTPKAAESQPIRRALFPSSVPDAWRAEGLGHFGSKILQFCRGCPAAKAVKAVPLCPWLLCSSTVPCLQVLGLQGSQDCSHTDLSLQSRALNLTGERARPSSTCQGSNSVYKRGSHLRNHPR